MQQQRFRLRRLREPGRVRWGRVHAATLAASQAVALAMVAGGAFAGAAGLAGRRSRVRARLTGAGSVDGSHFVTEATSGGFVLDAFTDTYDAFCVAVFSVLCRCRCCRPLLRLSLCRCAILAVLLLAAVAKYCK